MADSQRIHPVADVEAPPTRPSVTHGSFRSEKGEPVISQPAPFGRTIPVMHSKPPKQRSCCCKCVCWTVSLLLLLLIIIGAAAGILYLVFKPKIPKYSVDSLSISELRLNFDLSLYARFNVRITADNPVPRNGAKILPRPPEQDGAECSFNWTIYIRKNLVVCFAGAAANRKDSTGSQG